MFWLAGLALTLAACGEEPDRTIGWQDVAVVVHAAAPSEEEGLGARHGDLIFRGGLELSSKNALFGGWSGLEVEPDGRLIAVSDAGVWLKARLVTDEKTGALTGLADARIALMRDEEGDPLGGKINQDAEGLARLDDGRFAVSFERRHRIWIYDLDGAGPKAPAAFGPDVPADKLGENEGIEGLAPGPNGDLMGLTESSNLFYRYGLDGKSAPVSGEAESSEHYALVGLDRLANGDYVALERFYFPIIGVRNAIRLYPAAGLSAEPPALKGSLLAQFAPPLLVDNFESIAAIALPDGGTRLYILSDNNFSGDQKTLIYAFDVVQAEAPPPDDPPAP